MLVFTLLINLYKMGPQMVRNKTAIRLWMEGKFKFYNRLFQRRRRKNAFSRFEGRGSAPRVPRVIYRL